MISFLFDLNSRVFNSLQLNQTFIWTIGGHVKTNVMENTFLFYFIDMFLLDWFL